MKATDLKTLFISMSDEPNGAENVLLMSALAAKGKLLFLKKIKGGGIVIPPLLDVEYLTSKSMLLGFFLLIGVLKNYRSGCVIISTHSYLNGYLGFFKRIGYLRSRLIVRECTSVFTRYRGWKKMLYMLVYRLGYPGVDLIVCQTTIMRNQLLNQNKFLINYKVLVQENPIDLKKVREKANAPINLYDNKINFICAAGRLIPEKGFKLLIEAFNKIHKQYPELQLFIFGEGKERQSLVHLIDKYNLKQHVLLKGQTSNPMPYFKQAKVCVVSSVKEGFPNVLLEMMTVNRCVISTLCAGGIEDIPSITKIEVSNADALAEALDKTLKNDFNYTENEVENFLLKRSPEVFIQSIYNALEDRNSNLLPVVS